MSQATEEAVRMLHRHDYARLRQMIKNAYGEPEREAWRLMAKIIGDLLDEIEALHRDTREARR